MRYWVSWYSGYYADEGCTKPPFEVWVSGHHNRDGGDRDDCSICAVLDAESETQVWYIVAKYFPDYKQRFCNEVTTVWKPGNRFIQDESLEKGDELIVKEATQAWAQAERQYMKAVNDACQEAGVAPYFLSTRQMQINRCRFCILRY